LRRSKQVSKLSSPQFYAFWAKNQYPNQPPKKKPDNVSLAIRLVSNSVSAHTITQHFGAAPDLKSPALLQVFRHAGYLLKCTLDSHAALHFGDASGAIRYPVAVLAHDDHHGLPVKTVKSEIPQTLDRSAAKPSPPKPEAKAKTPEAKKKK